MEQPMIARLRIDLDGIEPPVMRRVEVPHAIRLDRLHQTIQAAMGWHDCHLWGFEVGEETYGPPMPPGAFGGGPKNATKLTLARALEETGADALLYIYDYGDTWEHIITVEAIEDAVPKTLYPRLLEATGACPPEDVGGLPGYEMFLEAMADPEHEDHEHYREWYGRAFDPSFVDIEVADALLKRFANRWKARPPIRKKRARAA